MSTGTTALTATVATPAGKLIELSQRVVYVTCDYPSWCDANLTAPGTINDDALFDRANELGWTSDLGPAESHASKHYCPGHPRGASQ